MGKRYRNTKMVKVREDRNCLYCNGLIKAGTECLTINKKMEGRNWICKGCISLIHKYRAALAEKNCLPFDDEGWHMAQDDYISEIEEEMVEKGLEDFIEYDEESKLGLWVRL